MTSILEVEQLDTLSSNASSTITIGGTNTTTIAFGPNVTTTPSSLANTPAFSARLSADTTISNETVTKIDFDEEIFDTDSAYDHSGNQRFTVPSGKAGKYFFSIVVHLNSGGAARLQNCQIYFYKNGSPALEQNWNFNSNDIFQAGMSIAGTFDLSVGDYIEGYVRMSNSTGTPSVEGANDTDSMFTGYRLIGA